MSIYTDAGMNKLTGTESWGCVVDENGKDLLEDHLDLCKDFNISKEKLHRTERYVIKVKFNDVASQQNNGGELLALVVGLRISLKEGFKEIKIDSDLLFKWWSIGKVNPKTFQKMDLQKKKYIEECVSLRKEFEKKGGQIIKISGNINKADLGFHKI